MKSKIRKRMLELAQILSTSTEHVKDSLQDMFFMDKRLAKPLVNRETLNHDETLAIAIQAEKAKESVTKKAKALRGFRFWG